MKYILWNCLQAITLRNIIQRAWKIGLSNYSQVQTYEAVGDLR